MKFITIEAPYVLNIGDNFYDSQEPFKKVFKQIYQEYGVTPDLFKSQITHLAKVNPQYARLPFYLKSNPSLEAGKVEKYLTYNAKERRVPKSYIEPLLDAGNRLNIYRNWLTYIRRNLESPYQAVGSWRSQAIHKGQITIYTRMDAARSYAFWEYSNQRRRRLYDEDCPDGVFTDAQVTNLLKRFVPGPAEIGKIPLSEEKVALREQLIGPRIWVLEAA